MFINEIFYLICLFLLVYIYFGFPLLVYIFSDGIDDFQLTALSSFISTKILMAEIICTLKVTEYVSMGNV